MSNRCKSIVLIKCAGIRRERKIDCFAVVIDWKQNLKRLQRNFGGNKLDESYQM